VDTAWSSTQVLPPSSLVLPKKSELRFLWDGQRRRKDPILFPVLSVQTSEHFASLNTNVTKEREEDNERLESVRGECESIGAPSMLRLTHIPVVLPNMLSIFDLRWESKAVRSK
jgi:hypothetical protein